MVHRPEPLQVSRFERAHGVAFGSPPSAATIDDDAVAFVALSAQLSGNVPDGVLPPVPEPSGLRTH